MEHGANFDQVEFDVRISEVMRLEQIYVRNPDLRLGSRRLGGVLFDHVNPKSILGRQRNLAPVAVGSVNLSTCWVLGATTAATSCYHPHPQCWAS